MLGTGVERGRLSKLGHWWGGQWIADGTPRGEVLLAGEALHLKPTDVFEVLLHEAAHGLNTSRGVKDTSRGGRYHNAKFKATAIEVGLRVGSMPPYGWAKTELAPATVEHYSSEIDRIGDEMRIARRMTRSSVERGGDAGGPDDPTVGEVEGGGAPQRPKPAECGCGRKMRMAPSVLARGPVVCSLCRTEFTVGRTLGQEQTAGNPVERGLLSTRPSSAVPVDQDELMDRLRRRLRTPEDAERLMTVASWRGAPNQEPEGPIVARDFGDHSQLTQLARAVLALDGTLSLPAGARGDVPLLTGERVRTANQLDERISDSFPEPGTPGQVTVVDLSADRVTIDFPTWGTTTVSTEDAYEALRWDYATVEPPPIERSAPDLEIEL
ncbi:MAG: hypothetical protein GX868_09810 [Actinobacteria bacterium]|nr:hypothetical protein [Actinomycetota bacterium]